VEFKNKFQSPILFTLNRAAGQKVVYCIILWIWSRDRPITFLKPIAIFSKKVSSISIGYR